jgi:hypothetical protein
MSSSETPPAPVTRRLTRAVGFCLVGVGLAFLLDGALLRGLRRIENGDFGVWNKLVAGQINAQILVVGGSRALVDVDCELMARDLGRSCFDIGLDGSVHNLQRPYLATYLAHNRPPELALISADIASLENATRPYRPKQYVPYLAEEPLFTNLATLEPTTWRERYVPLYAFAHHGLDLTKSAIGGLRSRTDAAAEPRILGQLRVETDWDGAFDNFMREVGATGKVFPVQRAALDVVADMVRMLRSRGSRVVVFYSPEWKGMHRYELNRAQVISGYRETAIANGATFLDYTAHPLADDRKYFYNSQHMNRRGAEIFTRTLTRDLAGLASAAPGGQSPAAASSASADAPASGSVISNRAP